MSHIKSHTIYVLFLPVSTLSWTCGRVDVPYQVAHNCCTFFASLNSLCWTCGRVDGQNEARNTFIWILTASIPYQVIYPVCTLFERLSTLSGGPVDVWTSHIKSHKIVVLSSHVSALSDGPVDVWTAKMKLEIHSYGY